ncbi:hypothetical protein QN362_16290 [Actimicrobium sp. CCC2.4]|uniref:hypothetical protein n=1 Tax=Actimicrobium sp. CCC2.4 TaxID=3048606 RepID=UPI002AC8B81C|nr:hypothetical protein [Actimicrobium sp. CCC2.4]MEB0136896.1 hypothetical protein [Actimicrobium sp. CCC2.4]WPX33446.1 hypothetical protein RHM62_06310 [Actimicrobium sp. CCC2.4]
MQADTTGMREQVTPVDLTAAPCERVLLMCEALAGCGTLVLHGSNVRPVLQTLEPRQANDRAKVSGNQCAVYASLDARVALMYALLDRCYLSARLGSWRVAYCWQAGQLRFCVSDNLYQLFCNGDPALLSDGVVYVLERRRFVPAADSATEFHALLPQRPVHMLSVAATLGRELFYADGDADGDAAGATVIRYPQT